MSVATGGPPPISSTARELCSPSPTRNTSWPSSMTFGLAATLFGSTPVEDGIRVSHEILENASDSRELQGWAVRMVGAFLMLDGRFEEARQHLADARAIFTELGNNAALVGLT